MNKTLISETIVPAELYIERDADRQIKKVIDEMGRPGYILVPRQMGKTNLLINAKRQLEGADDIFAYVDLSNRYDSARECFRSIVDTIIQSNYEKLEEAEEDIEERRDKKKLPPHREHSYELRRILRDIKGKLIINLDEIDSLTSSHYSDKIFAQIRSIYFERVNFKDFKRVSYILSGVAEPSEIIKDKSISPFNIGQKILLGDFSYDEFIELASRTNLKIDDILLDRIFYWINGNPRMTWEVLSEVEDILLSGTTVTGSDIDTLVKNMYMISFDRPPIDHIRSLVEADVELRNGVISLSYGKLDAVSDAIKSKLYLSGIINSLEENATFKNKVIESSLSDNWISSLSKNDSVSLEKASNLFLSEKYEEAEKQYKLLLEKESDDEIIDNINYRLCACYLYLGKFTLAIDYGLKAIDIEKYKREISWILGICYSKENNIEEAKKLFYFLVDSDEEDLLKYRSCVDLASILSKDINKNEEVDKLCNYAIESLKVSTDAETSREIRESQQEILYIAYILLSKVHSESKELSKEMLSNSVQYSYGINKIVPWIMLAESGVDINTIWPDIRSYFEDKSNIYCGQSEITNAYTFKANYLDKFLGLAYTLDDDEMGSYLAIVGELISKFEDKNLPVLENVIYMTAVKSQNSVNSKRSIMLLEYVRELDREILTPDGEFHINKYLSFLDGSNESAFDSYLQRVQNYVTSPDIIDSQIFEREISKFLEEGNLEKALSLADIILTIDVLSSLSTKITLVRIMYLKFMNIEEHKEKLNYARELQKVLDKIDSSNSAESRLNSKSLKAVKGNTNKFIIESTPIKQRILPRKYGRNEIVTVIYDEENPQVGKYKNFEDDIKKKKCVIVESS
ncbi:AAA-like domain-containing protein [Vibrio parahaemolyticus]|uniref:AAA-like domain-containing protein n=1 Tax=Vibrio parahaemolyticus TaxID=670 RepID=UPI001B828B68|nr:AAA-like domain-containing protein [Vibrio parahaemolyticus]EJC1077205.1 AAA-like domain-containing protein [Vibrio parahaemolyticus]EJK2182163.1 AAA-like domain-containing protein [Vibrio parahaemolyticus]ELA7771436.1 AAA-like domain-containing protein [Vibrio parahaemolyticus]MDF4983769.1 AAA-like domain-containing protein [Vibrio parahaemolyticus]HBC3942581.1 AAA-like domain-containing protein [Vibrio parahaemolyticus]